MNEPIVEELITGRAREIGAGVAVRRVLPAPARRSVGPFVFVDHMGPLLLAAGEGLDVAPHPHIGLATVTYLFEGAFLHRDSLGTEQLITPGDVNWMSAGRGIVHSERTPQDERAKARALHGLQLWVALPADAEMGSPTFEHYKARDLPELALTGGRARIIAGEAYGVRSPVRTATPTLYVDIHLDPGATLMLPRAPELAVYLVGGELDLGGQALAAGTMAVLVSGADVEARANRPSHFVLLGGAPLDGPRFIFWNFVSSSAARIESAARAWKAGGFSKIPGDDVEFVPLGTTPHFASTENEEASMPHQSPGDEVLREILTHAKTIAVVGASSNPEKASHGITKRLIAAGYRVFPVNPRETEILGQRSYASLEDVPERIDIVDVFRRAEDTPAIADEAVLVGAKTLWLQAGITNDEAADRARKAGLTVVMDKCIGATHSLLGIPKK